MGEAKRKKQNGTENNSVVLGKKIVQAWQEKNEDFIDLVESMLTHHHAAKIYEIACKEVDVEHAVSLRQMMMFIAGSTIDNYVDEDGQETEGDTETFLIPIFGDIKHINRMVRDQTTLCKIADLLVSSGVVHPDSDVVLHDDALPSYKIAFTYPHELLKIVDATITDWMALDKKMSNLQKTMQTLNMISEPDDEPDQEGIAGMRFLLGLRIIHSPGKNEENKFDPIASDPDQSEDMDDKDYETKLEFTHEVNELLERTGYNATVCIPDTWVNSLQTAAAIVVTSQFEIYGNQTNSFPHPQSRAHIAQDENNNLHIALQDPDGTWHGPAMLSMEYSPYTDSLLEWCLDNRPQPIVYEDIRDLRAVMSIGCGLLN
jgi:hypothetical protein